jgi:hypothetical protein
MTNQQEALCQFILVHNLEVSNESEELQRLMKNLTTSQVTECIEKAFKGYDNIKSSGLGRELL